MLAVTKAVELCVPSRLDLPPGATPTPTVTAPPTVTPTQTGATTTPTPTVAPTVTVIPTPTPTFTVAPTAIRTTTPTPTATASPIVRTCTIGGANSFVALQFRDTPLGDLRLQGALSGTQQLGFGGLDGATSERPIAVPASSMTFDPVQLPVPIGQPVRVCLTATGIDGTGKIDCNGGAAALDITTRVDHSTNAAPGSNGGSPQDPECDDTAVAPDGERSEACRESMVSTCNVTNRHPGTCNGPLAYVESGTFASGDVRLVEYVTIRQVSNVGPDGQQCTGDDTYGPPASVRVFFTTGTARATVFDANGVANALLDQGAPGCEACVTQVTGDGRACNQITGGSGSLDNLMLVSTFAVLDLDGTVGDAAVTIQAECQ